MEYESRYLCNHTDQLFESYNHYPQQIYICQNAADRRSSSDINDNETSLNLSRRLSKDDKNGLALLTVTSLGAFGGLMASKLFSSSKSKQRPAKQAPLPSKLLPASHVKTGTFYQETNYTHYKPGTNVNAHMKPVTYSSVSMNSSMVANAGSAKHSSNAGTSKPHKTHGYKNSSAAGLASIAAAGTAAAGLAVASAAAAGKDEQSKAHRRWSQQAASSTQVAGASTAAPNNTSYQAFDHSAGTQPLTSSVLAQHTYAHQQTQQSFPNNTSAVSAGAPAFAASPAYTAGAGVQSSAWSHEAVGPGSSRPATTYYGSGQQQQPHHQQPAKAGHKSGVAHSIAPSELESDMAQAGFSSMHSMYDPKKSGRKNKHSAANQGPAPVQAGNSSGYLGPQQQSYQSIAQPSVQTQQHPAYQYHGPQHGAQYGPQPIPIPHPAHAVTSGPSTGTHQAYAYANPQQQSQYPPAPPIFQSQTYPQAGHYHAQQPGPQQYQQQQSYSPQYNYQNHPQQQHQQPQPYQQQQQYQQQPHSQSLSQSAPVIFNSMPQLNASEPDNSYNQSMYFGSQPMPANNGYVYGRPKKQVHFAL